MHHTTDRIAHTTGFVTPVGEHWLEREIAHWVHPMKDRSDDSSHHERTLLPQSYISLPHHTYIIHTYIIHTHTYIHTHTHIHTRTYIHTYIHTYTYIHTHTHIHTRTYIHTRTHMQRLETKLVMLKGILSPAPVRLCLCMYSQTRHTNNT